jgi:hypothetical protein
MAAWIECVARFCCDSDDDDDEFSPGRRRLSHPRTAVVAPSAMARGTYQVAPRHEDGFRDDDNANDDVRTTDDCCHPRDNNNNNNMECRPGDDPHGLHEFFQKLRARWRKYDSMATTPRQRPRSDTLATTDSSVFLASDHQTNKLHCHLPLRTACAFDASREIPTIQPKEVVLPGSALQQQMARSMSLRLEGHGEECVICMDGFEPTNPRMPTTCGCGQNKTYFHLPCLYQWMEQSEECPSCRQALRWEEF